jgi:CelD/BcsL family acetyltransferase involved in cellulose biosynthesis
MLGKRTRTNLRYYHNKIRRDFDDFSFTVQASEVIDPSNISKIIDLNRKRMRSQKITSVFDTDYEHKIIEFCRAYGVVGFITVKNRIVAGAICYQVGTHCYAHIISHDYDYSKYSIGMVCNLLLIEVLIKRGVQKFHLDTGEMEFKNRLLGVKKTTYNYTVYRNSAYKILGNIIYLRKYEYVSRLINFIKFRIVQNIKHSLARDPEKNEFK